MAWPPGPEVGMIAGSLPHGLGGLLARFEGDNDGTVLVEETRSPQLADHVRSEEHTSELQSLMRISYAVFCLKKKKNKHKYTKKLIHTTQQTRLQTTTITHDA